MNPWIPFASSVIFFAQSTISSQVTLSASIIEGSAQPALASKSLL